MNDQYLCQSQLIQNDACNATEGITNSIASVEHNKVVETTIQEYMLRTRVSLEDVVRNMLVASDLKNEVE